MAKVQRIASLLAVLALVVFGLPQPLLGNAPVRHACCAKRKEGAPCPHCPCKKSCDGSRCAACCHAPLPFVVPEILSGNHQQGLVLLLGSHVERFFERTEKPPFPPPRFIA